MAGKHKTTGLFLGAVGIGILLACLIPTGLLVVLGGLFLITIGWLLLRKG